jgi:hypothetical protein
MNRMARWLLVALVVGACQTETAAGTPVARTVARWPSGETIAVYDGRSLDPQGHTVFVVGLKSETARVLASVTLASRTPMPAPACPPGSGCGGPIDPTYVSTSNDSVYVLDGDNNVDVIAPDASLRKVATIPGGSMIRSGFAVSPDNSMLAVGEIDFARGVSTVYFEKTGGRAHVDVFTSTNPVYWPVGWHGGEIVLAYGHVYGATTLNPYDASGYALVDPISGAKPTSLGAGDCVPSGTLVAAGSACIKDHGAQCIEGEVANPESTAYYNTCLRRLEWSGAETTFLVPYNAYTGTFTVLDAALSIDGRQILTDQLGTLDAPVSPTHGGNDFLGSYHVRVPQDPSMGWLDDQHYSFAYVYPDGVTRQRIAGATFEGMGDVAPGVSGSPVTGHLIGLVPAGLER